MNRTRLALGAILALLSLIVIVPKTTFAVFDPTQISGLQAWYDAQNGPLNASASAATDGQAVATWNDLSGNNNNATQSTAGSRPIYRAANSSSLTNVPTNINAPSIYFSGSTFLTLPNSLSINMASATVLVVSRNTPGAISPIDLASSTTDIAMLYTGQNSSSPYINLYPPPRHNISGSQISNNMPIVYGFETGTSTLTFFDDLGSSTQAATYTNSISFGGWIGKSNFGFPMTGDIYDIVIYNRALSTSEISQLMSYLQSRNNIVMTTRQLMVDGDSLSCGYTSAQGVCSSGGEPYINNAWSNILNRMSGFGNLRVQNFAVPSQTVPQMESSSGANINSQYNTISFPGASTNRIVALWGGTNDIATAGLDATTTYNNIVSFVNNRKTAGYKVIIGTIIDRGAFVGSSTMESYRQTVNTRLRQNWSTFADGLADVAADPVLGPSGASNSATYFDPDHTHLTTTGYTHVATVFGAAINGLTATITPSPTSGIVGTSSVIQLTAVNTNWSAGTPGSPTFTLTGGTGASITSQTITSSTTATITINNGSAAGTLTIVDPNTNASTTVTVIADSVAPAVGIVTPISNVTVNGTISLTATSSDNVAVTSVQFYVDNVALGTASSTSPYTVSWNSASVTDGSHTIAAVAKDAANNAATSTVTVTVSNTLATPVGISGGGGSGYINPQFNPFLNGTLGGIKPQNNNGGSVPTFVTTGLLKVGSVSPDVKTLQQYLNNHGFVIALAGPGSKGNETFKLGQLTKAALIQFQLKNKILPATGNFGPLTRAFIIAHP